MEKPDRTYCSVPECPRYMLNTTGFKRHGGDAFVFICGPHWRRLRPQERALWARMKRLKKKFGEGSVPPSRFWRVWDALARRAGSDVRLFAQLDKEFGDLDYWRKRL